MRVLSVVAAAVLIGLSSTAAPPSNEVAVEKLSNDFVYGSLALSPISATSAGYHVHNGVVLDELLDDYSARGLDESRAFLKHSRSEAARLSGLHPNAALQADLDVITLQCDVGLLDLDDIQSYRHNPTTYVEMVGSALYSPDVLEYAPAEKRYAHITARLEKLPKFLEMAKQNLVDSPEIWNQVAQEENQGNLDLVQSIASKVPADLKGKYERAAGPAKQALRAFTEFLKNDLSKRKSDWRLGARRYAAKFKLALATGDTPEQTLKDAEKRMEEIRQQMKQQAIAVYPKFFPGQTPPTDLNAVVSAVLGKIAQQHATPKTYFDEAKRDLAEATEFVKAHHLLALPERSNLKVIPTPEFMRGVYGVGGFESAPPLEPELGAFYWITPITPDMSAERVESKLREYNFYGLKILTIHEAMPGHYVQAEYANDIKPKWQGLLRTVFSNTPYVEGWAVYATELLIDEGYQKTPEMQLTFGKQMLRVVANTILDVKLQTMGMTDQQAIDLMIKQTFQESEEATKKLQRAKLSSCQLPTYFAGWRGWDQLRDAYRKKMGGKFSYAQFHEAALNQGALPLPVLTRTLLGE